MKPLVFAFGLLALSPALGQVVQSSYNGAYLNGPAANSAVYSSGAVAAAAPIAAARPPKVHEIHTTSEREVIRVEEYKRPRQVIRIHEAPAPPPEIIRVQAPPEPQKVIRVVQRARPTRVQFTRAGPEVQVVNIPIQQQAIQPIAVPVAPAVVAAPIVQRSEFRTIAAPVYTRSVAVAAPAYAPAPVSSSFQTFSPVAVNSFSGGYSSAPAVAYQSYGAAPVVSYGYGNVNAQYNGYYKKSSAKKA
jgi:hypothetical protein